MTTTTTETIARECRTCDGHGEIVERDSFRGRYYTSTRECMVCRGSGSIFTAAEITEPEPTPPAPATSGCTACNGAGERYTVDATGITWDRCPVCAGTGRYGATADGMIRIDGYTIHAPGFTAHSFDQAVKRAHDAGLTIHATDRADTVMVSSLSSMAYHSVTRTSCTCKAGQRRQPCMHRGMAIFMVSIMDLDTRTQTPMAA